MPAPEMWHDLARRKESRSCITQLERKMCARGLKTQLLYVGNEVMLSKATAELLKHAGYRVRTTNPTHARHALRDENFAAIILCATLNADESSEIVEIAIQTQPDTPIVSIHLGLLGDTPNPYSVRVVDALHGPEALVQAVHSVARVPPRHVSKAV